MTATVTTLGTNPSSLTVSVVDAILPGLNITQSASRYWTLTEGGNLTADLAFTYLDSDINGDETVYKVFRREGGITLFYTNGSNTNNAATNTATVTGVTDFSDWGIGSAPTAAAATVGGRVTTQSGRGVFRAKVVMSDQQGNIRTAYTTAFGFYRFADVPSGETYILSASHKRYQFGQPTQVYFIGSDEPNINFTATGENQNVNPNQTYFDNAPFDFDGDGRTDISVFRPSDGNWYIKRSSDNGWYNQAFGLSSDRLVPADYDGDGKTDLAVYRPSDGNWYIWLSASNALHVEKFDLKINKIGAADKLIPSDYDGDGKADLGMCKK